MSIEIKKFTLNANNQEFPAFLVVDEKINNEFCGGIRIQPNLTLEILQDLAQTMTLKHKFLGIPKGGARAGVLLTTNIDSITKQLLLNSFGKKVKSQILSGEYLPAPDLDITAEMMDKMYQHIGYKTKIHSSRSINSSYYTALSVFECIKVAVSSTDQEIHHLKYCVEGFGKVGSQLSLLLYDAGAKVVSVSNKFGLIYSSEGLPVPQLVKKYRAFGDAWIKKQVQYEIQNKNTIWEIPADAICPCALSHQINNSNMASIKARYIFPGSNFPVTNEALEFLNKKGVLVVPDFISNCGGVLGNTAEYLGLKEKDIKKLLSNEIASKLKKIIEFAKHKAVPPTKIAIQLTQQARTFNKPGKKTLLEKIKKLIITYYQKGFIPKFVLRPFAMRYLQKMVTQDSKVYK